MVNGSTNMLPVFVFVFANPKHITAIHPMHILDVDMMRSQ